MNYSKIKEQAERIKKDYSILEYFQNLVGSGYLKYEGVQGKEHFFGFLDQRTGSIAVDDKTNVWYDHAAGKGGDILEAVQVFENRTFFQSVKRLSGSLPVRSFIPRQKSEITPRIVVEKVLEISHDALVNYIRKRGLEPDEISQFAKEVHWRNRGKRYFAVGFPNKSGGWVLRSSIFKGNILGGGISIQVLGKPGKTKIFEGWFDFLSYLKLSGATDFKAIILNSTANLSFRLMLDILTEGKSVDLYLDNDSAGEKCTSDFIKVAKLFRYCREKRLSTAWDLVRLRRSKNKIAMIITNLKINVSESAKIWNNQINVSDQRCFYKDFEDVNAFLMDGA
ncbi:MAG: toprim domain-containing protein [Algoriphagus sp.]|uniref:toprim domain-containing protein n=1 Tax=Algoriphagus sp. TaxID=1872435 RepID=UPI00261FADBD|nr:toprim domain-containing protein [Algoriphagus sp.]MDG1277139.1 toprim domain-containing protein [Algoriphagus sp.]